MKYKNIQELTNEIAYYKLVLNAWKYENNPYYEKKQLLSAMIEGMQEALIIIMAGESVQNKKEIAITTKNKTKSKSKKSKNKQKLIEKNCANCKENCICELEMLNITDCPSWVSNEDEFI